MNQIPETEKEKIQLRLTAAAQLAGSGKRLLDVGCSSGQLATLLKGRFSKLNDVDCDSRALETVSARAGDCRFSG